jgi:hypothetical protein
LARVTSGHPGPGRPATDAILLTIRVHQGNERSPIGDPPRSTGAELEAAGRRILVNHLRRAVRLGSLEGAAGQRAGQQFVLRLTLREAYDLGG